MSTVGKKMRARRESWFPVAGFEFNFRLPTKLQIAVANQSGKSNAEIAIAAVIDWRGVRQCDLIPGEPDAPAPFEADACSEWLGERLDLLGPLMLEIKRLQDERAAKLEAAEKN